MKKNYLFLALLSTYLGYSQFTPSAPWTKRVDSETSRKRKQTIDEISASFNSYWSNHDKNKKGSGYKPFKRWENHWKDQTNGKGTLISPKEMWTAMSQIDKASLSSSVVSNWTPVGPFESRNTGSWSTGQGRVSVVCVDPSDPKTIYAGSPSGGIWKSVDTGIHWIPLSDQLPQIGVSGIAIDYLDAKTIYIATGDKDAFDTYSIGVVKSTDGGITWNKTGLEFTDTESASSDIIIHPANNQILWCATSKGIYKTTDAGVTWTNVQVGYFSQGAMRLKPNDSNTLYAVSDTDFYRSIDGGATFDIQTSGLPETSSRLLLDVSPADPSCVYVMSTSVAIDENSSAIPPVVAVPVEFQGIYKSTDSGSSFIKKTSNETTSAGNVLESNQSWYDLAFAVSNTNADEIYTGCLNIWKSTDGGTTVTKTNNWDAPETPSYTHADIHFLKFMGDYLYAGTDGGIYQSSDGGAHYSNLTKGLQISQLYKIAVSKQSVGKMVGGLQDNGGYAYSNEEWKNYYGADGMDTAIDPNNSSKYYGFIQEGSNLYISLDGGNTLSYSVGAPLNPDGSLIKGNWVTPLTVNSAGEVFAGYADLYKLNGLKWEKISTNSFGSSGNLDRISIDPSNDNIMYVINGKELYKSTDKGITFSLVHTNENFITSVAVHSTDSGIIYMTTFDTTGEALKSFDGGASFTSFSEGLPAITKRVIKHQARHSLNPLYIGTTLGVYYRDDSMSQWEPFATNLPRVNIPDLEINLEDAKIIAATYGRGVWESPIKLEAYPTDDVGLISINYPALDIENGSVVPQVTIQNKGSNPINMVEFSYQYNGTPLSYTWNNTLAPGEKRTLDLPKIMAQKGVYILDVIASIINDAYSNNNHFAVPFFMNDYGTAGILNTFDTDATKLLTYNEGFVIPSQWQTGVRTGGDLDTATNKVYTTNLTGNYPDRTKAYLLSSSYNLTQIADPVIKFKMAFDLEENWDIVYVEYTTDFGKSWTVLGTMGTNWYNSNQTQATTGADCYNCPGKQWTGFDKTLKEYSYPLNSLATASNVIFRIVFHSDDISNQQGVVVDDFIIGGTVLSTSKFELDKVALYPNPSKGFFTVDMGTVTPKSIEVYDLIGKIIYTEKEFKNDKRSIAVDLSAATSGIYFVKIASENQSVVKRIVKN